MCHGINIMDSLHKESFRPIENSLWWSVVKLSISWQHTDAS